MEKGYSLFYFIGDNMNRKKIYLLILIVLLFSGTAQAQDKLPINPAPGYYGNVLVNGQQAPPGTTIIAKIAGEVRGSITTSIPGLYGDNPGPSKLWLISYDNELSPTPATITFYLNEIASQQTGTLTGTGTINRVNLSFIIPSGGASAVSSSAGGGGGGVVSSESFENIDFFESRDADIIAGIPITFRFTTPEISVYELVITSNISAGLVSAKIEHLKSPSRLVVMSSDWTIYKNVNILLGTSGFAVSRNIKEGIIRFRIENDWLSGENIEANKVSMMKWEGNHWISLETKHMRTDDKFAYYETWTNSFSPFVITGEKTVPAPVSSPTAILPEVSTIQTPPDVSPPADFNWILYIIVAIIVISMVFYYVRKKK